MQANGTYTCYQTRRYPKRPLQGEGCQNIFKYVGSNYVQDWSSNLETVAKIFLSTLGHIYPVYSYKNSDNAYR